MQKLIPNFLITLLVTGLAYSVYKTYTRGYRRHNKPVVKGGLTGARKKPGLGRKPRRRNLRRGPTNRSGLLR